MKWKGLPGQYGRLEAVLAIAFFALVVALVAQTTSAAPAPTRLIMPTTATQEADSDFVTAGQAMAAGAAAHAGPTRQTHCQHFAYIPRNVNVAIGRLRERKTWAPTPPPTIRYIRLMPNPLHSPLAARLKKLQLPSLKF